MKRILLLIVLQVLVLIRVQSQAITVDQLVSLTSMSSKSIDRFMEKNKYVLNIEGATGHKDSFSFIQKLPAKKRALGAERSLDLYKTGNSLYYIYHTASEEEFLEGRQRLIKDNFFYDQSRSVSKDSILLFQKRNIAIKAIPFKKDSTVDYIFELEEKQMPDLANMQHAEDLLRFTSHEFLASFFGEKNVQKDQYFFAENELKKCSVLFPKSSHQVVFVWGDEINLNNLSYILVSNLVPTVSAAKYDGVFSNNEWKLENGIYAGMSLQELMQLNENDFEIYGNPSEFSFMVKPGDNGKVDFTKTAVMMSCKACNTDRLFDKTTVRARDVIRENLPMYVFDIVLYPTHP